MQYEWDEKKRQRNIAEKGIDFSMATAFEWGKATHEPDERKEYDELRILSFAPIHNRIHALCWTQRGENVRIISLRKANRREVMKYEQTT